VDHQRDGIKLDLPSPLRFVIVDHRDTFRRRAVTHAWRPCLCVQGVSGEERFDTAAVLPWNHFTRVPLQGVSPSSIAREIVGSDGKLAFTFFDRQG
jgi:hypothetical protein